MPNLRPFSLLAPMLLGLVACGQGDAPASVLPDPALAPAAAAPPASAPGDLGESEVGLAMMASHKLSATDDLTFVGAVDTRCPSGLECVRASEAYALFLVQSAAQPALLLTLPLDSASQDVSALRQRSARGYRIRLLSLDPVPAMGTDVTNEDYVARVRIETDAAGEQATDPHAQLLELDPHSVPGAPPAGAREDIPSLDGWARHTIGLHERVDLSDTAAVTLAGVIESRCPAQAACVAAGQAHVLFLVTAEGQPPQAMALQWNAQFRQDPALRWKSAAGHRVFLEAIDPAPESGAITPAVSYRATLRIEGLETPSGSESESESGNIR